MKSKKIHKTLKNSLISGKKIERCSRMISVRMIRARMISARIGAGLIAPDFWWFFIRARTRGCSPQPFCPANSRGGGASARGGGGPPHGGGCYPPLPRTREPFCPHLLLLPSFYPSNSLYHCQIKNHIRNIFCYKELLFLNFLETPEYINSLLQNVTLL